MHLPPQIDTLITSPPQAMLILTSCEIRRSCLNSLTAEAWHCALVHPRVCTGEGQPKSRLLDRESPACVFVHHQTKSRAGAGGRYCKSGH